MTRTRFAASIAARICEAMTGEGSYSHHGHSRARSQTGKGNDYRKQVQLLQAHIRKQGFYVIDRDPTDAERKQHALIAKVIVRSGGYNAERTRMDLPVSIALITAVQSTSAHPIVRLPTAGGSLPLSIITDRLRTDTITVSIANYDNHQRAENENLRLQNLWDGIETMAAVMSMHW